VGRGSILLDPFYVKEQYPNRPYRGSPKGPRCKATRRGGDESRIVQGMGKSAFRQAQETMDH
ncbi:hypothetical protein, partial [Salinibacter ruber]|uniref:hypothetical protein n=1 Tax=Salinibacter ruber TaxID=146919 RepID=UPI002072A62B